jgi:hypothetical protein
MKLNVWKFAWQMPSANGFHISGIFLYFILIGYSFLIEIPRDLQKAEKKNKRKRDRKIERERQRERQRE